MVKRETCMRPDMSRFVITLSHVVTRQARANRKAGNRRPDRGVEARIAHGQPARKPERIEQSQSVAGNDVAGVMGACGTRDIAIARNQALQAGHQRGNHRIRIIASAPQVVEWPEGKLRLA